MNVKYGGKSHHLSAKLVFQSKDISSALFGSVSGVSD